jgi:hypothetical protein
MVGGGIGKHWVGQRNALPEVVGMQGLRFQQNDTGAGQLMAVRPGREYGGRESEFKSGMSVS